jgi:hypothetical protein
MYDLCGIGRGTCEIPGKGSRTRGQLVRREGLELALYTFKFAPDIDSVIELLPPAPPVSSETPRFVFYARKSDFKHELSRPLRETLPVTPPPKPESTDRLEAPLLERVRQNHVFRLAGVEQLQDGTVALVLDALPG